MSDKIQRLREIVRTEVRNLLDEMEGDEVMDSRYFRSGLDNYIGSDYTTPEEDEYLDFLQSLLNQRYPDGDINKEDIFELSRSLDLRDYAEKVDVYHLINDIWKNI